MATCGDDWLSNAVNNYLNHPLAEPKPPCYMLKVLWKDGDVGRV